MFQKNVTNVLVICWGYIGNFLGFGNILDILQVLGGTLLILEILELFWSFQWFLSIFSDFRDIGGILVILEVSWVFCSF